VAIAFAALAAKVGAQASATAGPPPESAASAAPAPTAADGRRVYTSFCTRCHGINLVSSGGAYFDLRTLQQADKDRFLRSVAKGLRAMPAWEGMVTQEQMELLWLYVGSVNGWAK